MTLEEAQALKAKAEEKRLRQLEYNKRQRDKEKALLAEASEVIAAAERAAKANGAE